MKMVLREDTHRGILSAIRLLIFALVTSLLGACGNGGSSSDSDETTPTTPSSLPIPERVQAKVNNEVSNVAATISIDDGTPQEMIISGRSATFQIDNLDAKEHKIVIRFYQILGNTRIPLAENTSTVTVVAGQTASFAPDAQAYVTDSFDEDKDGIPNVDDDDNDNDGITDENEVAYGWNPLDNDSDHNGVKDGDEVPALTIATPIPAGVRTKIATTGVVVNAGIVVDGGTEREMSISENKARFSVLALLPGDHVVVITFYQRFGSERIVLARSTTPVAVIAGQAATLGDGELTYDTAFDADNDAVKNIVDSDNDGDGIADVNDPFPLNGSETLDSDGDGIGNNTDTDDDNDGVPDASDAFPLDAAESIDTDSDGTGNNADTDDDNDGIPDVDEARYGKNPLVADSDGVAIQISGRGDHTCVVVFNGKVRCWGLNQDGQLGNGQSTPSSEPVFVTGVSTAAAVRASFSHSCAKLRNGSFQCWGSNSFQESDVAALAGSTDIQLTLGISCGIKADSHLSCLGDSSNPIMQYQDSTVVGVGAGEYHSCVVVSGGGVSCYANPLNIGANSYGQIGNNTVGPPLFGPVTVNNIANNAAAVAVGANHSCALLQDHTIKCWGRNNQLQLGNSSASAASWVPIDVGTIIDATELAVGAEHNCALLESGGVVCWGSNASGQLGNGGNTDPRSDPVPVTGISNAISISAGQAHSCAVLANGRVQCWGKNTEGQLGNGNTTSSSNVPVFVNGF